MCEGLNVMTISKVFRIFFQVMNEFRLRIFPILDGFFDILKDLNIEVKDLRESGMDIGFKFF